MTCLHSLTLLIWKTYINGYSSCAIFLSRLVWQSKSPFVSGDIFSCSVIYTCGKTLQAANTNPNTACKQCMKNVSTKLTGQFSVWKGGCILKNKGSSRPSPSVGELLVLYKTIGASALKSPRHWNTDLKAIKLQAFLNLKKKYNK